MVCEPDPWPESGSTERELASRCARLEAEVATLRAIFDAIPTPVYAKDKTGRYLRCNRAYEEIWSAAPGSLDGKTAHDIMPPDFAQSVEAMDDDLLRLGGVEQFESSLPDPTGGRQVLIRKTTFAGPDGTRAGLVGVAADISDIRRTEAALRKSESRFRTVFEHAGMGIVLADTNGYVIEANQAFLDLLGYSPEELKSMPFSSYTHPEDLRGNLKLLEEMRAGLRTGYQLEKRYRRKDGEMVWTALTVTAVAPEDGTALVLGIIEDITARKEMEAERAALNERLESLVAERTAELSRKAAELVTANARLREEDARKSAFLTAVSHELRTPLTSLLGFTRLIGRDLDRHLTPATGTAPDAEARTERIRRNLDIIRSEGERLSRLVNDVLDLNRLEAGLLSLRSEPMDILACIKSAARVIFPLFIERPELRLALELPAEAPCVRADPDRLHQVLLNLLGNALKYTERGLVTVRLERMGTDRLAVSVADSGIGIPHEEQARIFEPFHQVAVPGSGPVSGTGLGLAISRMIIEGMNGRIEVASTPGQGSTFTIFLPLAADTATHEERTRT